MENFDMHLWNSSNVFKHLKVREKLWHFRAIVHVFEGKETEEDRDNVYTVHVSYMEIYNEEIRDLLSGDQSKKLEIKGQHGVVAGDFDR